MVFKHLLLQVLKLQLHIQSITAKYGDNQTVGLQDICFKPLDPDNTNCTIMSIFQYFQNNPTKMNQEVWDFYHFYKLADYIDHMMSCFQ